MNNEDTFKKNIVYGTKVHEAREKKGLEGSDVPRDVPLNLEIKAVEKIINENLAPQEKVLFSDNTDAIDDGIQLDIEGIEIEVRERSERALRRLRMSQISNQK